MGWDYRQNEKGKSVTTGRKNLKDKRKKKAILLSVSKKIKLVHKGPEAWMRHRPHQARREGSNI
jgi:hypothetical protein